MVFHHFRQCLDLPLTGCPGIQVWDEDLCQILETSFRPECLDRVKAQVEVDEVMMIVNTAVAKKTDEETTKNETKIKIEKEVEITERGWYIRDNKQSHLPLRLVHTAS